MKSREILKKFLAFTFQGNLGHNNAYYADGSDYCSSGEDSWAEKHIWFIPYVVLKVLLMMT
jgi:hypothetical protein